MFHNEDTFRTVESTGGFHPPYPLAPRFAIKMGSLRSLRGTGGKGDVIPLQS